MLETSSHCPVVPSFFTFLCTDLSWILLFWLVLSISLPGAPGGLTSSWKRDWESVSTGCKAKNYTLNSGNSDVRKNTYFRLLILQWAQDGPCKEYVSTNTPFFDKSTTQELKFTCQLSDKVFLSFLLFSQLWKEWACREDTDPAACSGTGLQHRWEWPEAICMTSACFSVQGGGVKSPFMLLRWDQWVCKVFINSHLKQFWHFSFIRQQYWNLLGLIFLISMKISEEWASIFSLLTDENCYSQVESVADRMMPKCHANQIFLGSEFRLLCMRFFRTVLW